MKKSICTHCYHQNNCPVDPNYKAERAPAIITTCTDYDPKQDYNEQLNDITVPMSQVPEEIKQGWIQEHRQRKYIGIINHTDKYPIFANNKDEALDKLHHIATYQYYAKNRFVQYLSVKPVKDFPNIDALICPEYAGICPHLKDCDNCPKHQEYADFLDRQEP